MMRNDLIALIAYYEKEYRANSYTPEERAQLREALTFTKGGTMPPDLSTLPPLEEDKVFAWVKQIQTHLKTWDPIFRDFLGKIPRLSAKDRDRLAEFHAKEMVEYREKFTLHMKKCLKDEFYGSIWEKFPDILEIFGCSESCPVIGCHGWECPSDLWDIIEREVP